MTEYLRRYNKFHACYTNLEPRHRFLEVKLLRSSN